MERFFENENRRLSDERAREYGHVFSIEQTRDICELVKNRRWPDGHYGDDECNLWSLLREYFWEE